MPTPQLILFLDPQGNLCAEGPGQNGMRQKIELPAGLELLTLRAELLAQRDKFAQDAAREKAIEDREARERRERIFARTLRNHGPTLAEKVVPGHGQGTSRAKPAGELNELEALEA